MPLDHPPRRLAGRPAPSPRSGPGSLPGRRHGSRRRTATLAIALAATVTWAGVGCSDTPDTSGSAFCGALAERMPVITAPVTDATGVEALIDAYEELDARTPLAIAEPWSALTALVRTAATVAPEDPESVQSMADTAYQTERSARAVATWVAQTCGFAMPAMSGVEGPVDPPPSTTRPKKKRTSSQTTTASTTPAATPATDVAGAGTGTGSEG